MRQVLILGAIFLLVPLAFFAPFTGLVSYVGIAYVRPHEWAYMPDAPISLAVAVATLTGYVIFELTRRAPQLTANWLLLLLWVQISLATVFAHSTELAQGKWVEFSKTFLIALLMTAMVDSEKRVRWLLLGTVLAIGFLAFRSNIGIILARGQTRIYGPGGAFEDNNDYALLLNVAAPIAFFVARAETKAWLRKLCYALSVMMMITVLFTLSRGGFLGLCVVLLGIAWKSKYKVTGLLAIAFAGLIAFVVVPSRVVERVGTISTASETDQSAQMRFNSWYVCGQIMEDHPLLGIGPRNMLQLYGRYLETESVRVAHNSFLQMAVDAGLPALLMFLGLIGLSLWRLRQTRQVLKDRAPDSPLIAFAHGMEIALIGYFVSAQFLSRHDLELIYEIFALAVSFRLLARDVEPESVPLAMPSVLLEPTTLATARGTDPATGA
ncbi:MAG TPA: putative O-glycosylation ligase, exosortase A system-associated [Blastocatellia bacterium]|nr:putative O-glycosylation ligase, exosortase A system-associated [Blastocatellia bacterium]HMV86616.1 putative O-glycosylation ligase, exosortase A system-associated [Blastocatellia bacterium]HMX28930.1 putative O-glycosylation ligase, exosortase A system-associated [Blastocatellia bacterium]HMY71348.1 putative O-glycosylation ligase, exosortase A system-associated [Blastocatellia bacterium]HMZ21896.1 putative O-glycosylation ligase, exosortase A system-associated [Blastocatellia bacterium]